MTDKQLIAHQQHTISTQAQRIDALEGQLNQLLKWVYGQKSERFVAGALPDQLSIFEADELPSEPEEMKEQIQYERKKSNPHPGRNHLPDHLPIEEIVIEPDASVAGLRKIGEEVTETLEYTPASLVRKRVIRPKYAKPEGAGVLIAELPARPIEKGIAEVSLLAHILVSKFVDHLPYYRQIAIFKRDFHWTLAKSTVNDWMAACCMLLRPLYETLRKEIWAHDYLQADESPLQVLNSNKKGKTHQGYMWVYRSPESGLACFHYRKGRGQHGPREMLADFEGYLQTDGYQVYDNVCAGKPITQLCCLAHARRKLYDAQQSDTQRSTYALEKFAEI